MVVTEFKALYYDLAMSANQPTFDALRTLAPLSQIMVGTDFPFQPTANVARNIANFRALNGLSPEEQRAIARENALRLFPHFARVDGQAR
jgi:predicted TIM-barrel fold metal-dependent hydrolase